MEDKNMPCLDMPIEQLKTYMGSSPCAKDIDSFWDAALAEMNSLPHDVSLVKSEFQVPFAECFDLYFTGVRGAKIHAKYLRPKNAPTPHPAILQFHGYSMNAGDWANKLGFVAMGYSVAALDCRGQGGDSEDVGGVSGTTLNGHIIRGLDDGPSKLLFRDIYLDTAQLAKIVMGFPEVDAQRVGATGGSQGGALTIACAALEPRIKKLAPIYPFLSDYKRVWDMDLALDAYHELKQYFRHHDPNHEREDDVFMTLSYIDVQNIAKRIKGEVQFVTGLMDNICPPSTQFSVYNKITSPKNMVIYPDFGHEFLPGVDDKIMQFMSDL